MKPTDWIIYGVSFVLLVLFIIAGSLAMIAIL
jgi:Na+-transporting methylmalonyl-CoA/oxaloacetate decarboxylase gamma subunit